MKASGSNILYCPASNKGRLMCVKLYQNVSKPIEDSQYVLKRGLRLSSTLLVESSKEADAAENLKLASRKHLSYSSNLSFPSNL